MVAVTAAPGSIFSLISLLKVEAGGKEKKTRCRKGRYRLTCHRWGRKTPGQGAFSSPRRDRARGSHGVARRQRRSARCPLGGAAPLRPPPPPAPRSQPSRQGPGNPPARFFCAVSAKLRGSWSFCSTIYRLRQHCEKEKAERWPLPPSHRLQREKSPSTRPKYTARQSPAGPSLPLAAAPSPGALPTPSRVRQGKPAAGGSALPARLREGSGGVAHPCAQLVGSGRGPGVAHSVGTPAFATQRVPLGPRLVGVFPSFPRFRPLPPSLFGVPPPCSRSVRAFGPRLGARGRTCLWRLRFPRP